VHNNVDEKVGKS